MCGISGIWSLDIHPDTLSKFIQTMTQRLAHRGPDGFGIWTHPNNTGLALGHRRLSIYDLSTAGNQPMTRRNEQYTLTFNGAIYNFRSLRKDLISRGVNFQSQSDTEVLLELLIMDGVERTLPRLEGMFAFAFWDANQEKLTLARDIWGKKPLLYQHTNTQFSFASELSALRIDHGRAKTTLNEDAAYLMLAFGNVPEPMSIQNGVEKLPPGHMLEIKTSADGTLQKSIRPWTRRNAIETLQPGNTKTVFDALFTKAVSRRLSADVPVGAFLSGGIDSSLVTAYAQTLHTQKLKTFTIGFDVEGYDESSYATAVAKHLNTEHHSLTLTAQDMEESCLQSSSWFDEPFADTSAIPVRLLSAYAREHVTVALTGDGGDETCLGYPLHLKNTWMVRALETLPLHLRNTLSRLLLGKTGNWWQKSLRQAGAAEHYFTQRTGSFSPNAYYMDTIRDRLPDLQGRRSDAEWLADCDLNVYLVDDMLTKTDRASMSVGLELRAPLLDQSVVSLMRTLPLNAKVNNGKGKMILRQALSEKFPANFFDRPKSGFRAPIGVWLNRPILSDWSRHHAQSFDTRFGWTTADGLNGVDLWNSNKVKPEQYGSDLWRLSILMDWLEKNAL